MTLERQGSQARRPPVAAAIDLGSNSVHVLVAAVHGHRLEPLLDTSAFLGLGRAVHEGGSFGPELQARLAETLAGYVTQARQLGAGPLAILGTDPLRRSADAADAVGEIEARTGITVDVIGNEEEALLTLLGVTAGRPVLRDLVVVDIGGGSSEVLAVGPESAARAIGLPIGSARLAGQFVQHDPPTAAELDAMLATARAVVAQAPDITPSMVIAVGGTATNLLRIVRPSRDLAINRKRLAEAMFFLLSEPAASVAARFGLREERARVLPAGAAIVGALFERYGVERIRVSNASLRDGAILAIVHGGSTWRTHLEWLAHGWSRGAPGPAPAQERPVSEAGEDPTQSPSEEDAGD
jgi:exopolyphosphatase / guanosine-5'-triphosphate,3'-diphosphate pyrophosphatase